VAKVGFNEGLHKSKALLIFLLIVVIYAIIHYNLGPDIQSWFNMSK
jgi:hypothetical protein